VKGTLLVLVEVELLSLVSDCGGAGRTLGSWLGCVNSRTRMQGKRPGGSERHGMHVMVIVLVELV